MEPRDPAGKIGRDSAAGAKYAASERAHHALGWGAVDGPRQLRCAGGVPERLEPQAFSESEALPDTESDDPVADDPVADDRAEEPRSKRTIRAMDALSGEEEEDTCVCSTCLSCSCCSLLCAW